MSLQLRAKVVTHAVEQLQVLAFRASRSNWFLVCSRMFAVTMTKSDFERVLIMLRLAGNERNKRIAFRTLFSKL